LEASHSARRPRRRGLLAILLATVVVGTTIAGTVVSTASGSGAATITVTRSMNSVDYTILDIQKEEASQNTFAAGFYDRLVAMNPKGDIVPYLGTPTKVTTKSITFKIRNDAKCPDGTKITPQVVADSFKRMIEVPKLRVNYMSGYFGNGPYAATADNKAGTFTFRVGTPYRNLIYGFVAPASVVVCPAGLKALASDPNALDEKEYGSGPYRLVSATHGVKVILERRPGWNWGPVINGKKMTYADLPDQQVFIPIASTDAAVNLALTGDLDEVRIGGVGSNLDRMNAAKDFAKVESPDYNPTRTMMFNMRPGKFTADEPLRRAMAMVTDQKTFGQAEDGGLATYPDSLLLPGVPCYKSFKSLIPTGTTDQAKAVLTKAGYTYKGDQLIAPNGQLVKITLVTNQATMLAAVDYVFDQYKKLGIDVDLRNVVGTTYNLAFLGGNFDVTFSANVANVKNAVGARFFYWYGPSNENGGSNVAAAGGPNGDPVMNREFRLALGTLGPESCAHFNKAIQIGLQKVYWKPILNQTIYLYYRKSKIQTYWQGWKGGDPLYMIANR
jgi:peptide/nickel transport system substrate-binding protein